mmetsp:Transcript_13376/g.28043  ORF Transcript_13376/g.28043 Transcript_13376/m.28043 type:complete len:328 (-) Transcript_13376:1259-2242(-)
MPRTHRGNNPSGRDHRRNRDLPRDIPTLPPPNLHQPPPRPQNPLPLLRHRRRPPRLRPIPRPAIPPPLPRLHPPPLRHRPARRASPLQHPRLRLQAPLAAPPAVEARLQREQYEGLRDGGGRAHEEFDGEEREEEDFGVRPRRGGQRPSADDQCARVGLQEYFEGDGPAFADFYGLYGFGVGAFHVVRQRSRKTIRSLRNDPRPGHATGQSSPRKNRHERPPYKKRLLHPSRKNGKPTLHRRPRLPTIRPRDSGPQTLRRAQNRPGHGRRRGMREIIPHRRLLVFAIRGTGVGRSHLGRVREERKVEGVARDEGLGRNEVQVFGGAE